MTYLQAIDAGIYAGDSRLNAFFDIGTVRLCSANAKLHPRRVVLTDLFSHGLEYTDEKCPPIFRAAAPSIGSCIELRCEKLANQGAAG